MFGKLRVKSCQLDDSASALYRGHFCGSCHAMREQSGRFSTLLTNYDQTVLSLVLGGLEGAEVAHRPCTAMPLREVPVVQLSPGSRTYLAAVNLLLVDAKLRDDVADDGRWRSRLGAAVIRRPARRGGEALRGLGLAPERLLRLPVDQAEAEDRARRAVRPSLARLSEPTAAALAWVFRGAAVVAGAPGQGDSLARFGAALGRFVYAVDAWEDRAEDREKGRFNAVEVCRRGGDVDAQVADQLRESLATMEAELATGWAGDRTGILRGLLTSMRGRVRGIGAGRAEAGDCDGCDCCCGDDGCGCCNGCDCCNACDCCDCVCCDRGSGSKKRRKKAEAARSAELEPDREFDAT